MPPVKGLPLRRLAAFLVLGFALAFGALAVLDRGKAGTPVALFERIRSRVAEGDLDVLWSHLTPAARASWAKVVAGMRKEPDGMWGKKFREQARVSKEELLRLPAEALFRRELESGGAALLGGATLQAEVPQEDGSVVLRVLLRSGDSRTWKFVRQDGAWAVDDLHHIELVNPVGPHR
jgi:hypothetical protein